MNKKDTFDMLINEYRQDFSRAWRAKVNRNDLSAARQIIEASEETRAWYAKRCLALGIRPTLFVQVLDAYKQAPHILDSVYASAVAELTNTEVAPTRVRTEDVQSELHWICDDFLTKQNTGVPLTEILADVRYQCSISQFSYKLVHKLLTREDCDIASLEADYNACVTDSLKRRQAELDELAHN